MLPLAYTESVELKNHLKVIDSLRRDILSAPVSPKVELKLRWEAKATRIHSSLALSHNLFSRGQVVKILATQTKHLPSDYSDVIYYKHALDYIEEHFTANPRPTTINTVIAVSAIALNQQADALTSSMSDASGPIRTLLEYLENQSDHPVIQAGIAQCILSTSAPIPGDSGVIARLMGSLYLAKYGYDLRGLITVEKQWITRQTSYELALASLSREGNLNLWLLYFTQTLEENYRERFEDLTKSRFRPELPSSFWELNDRQKGVLEHLSDPASSMTNRKVQKIFGVSQITASRDLSRLALLGLIFPHGKGRSITYTRA
ncbi:MAG TPA: hypothetical protein VMR81_03950 [Patescibacteria group bacterium]|jgi:hypothetical protein|nr:hypothetical protein [Patescibacteria group bacterium]